MLLPPKRGGGVGTAPCPPSSLSTPHKACRAEPTRIDICTHSIEVQLHISAHSTRLQRKTRDNGFSSGGQLHHGQQEQADGGESHSRTGHRGAQPGT